MSDLKMNFDKLNKACKEVNENWRKMMKENNPFDTISKIAKDIAERRDKEVALEFTKDICTLFKNNGVSPTIEEYIQDIAKENSIEQKYGVAITGLDFTEHDRVFKDKIAKLEKQIKSYEAERKELRTRCCMDSAREKFDNHSYGGLVIYTKNFTSECERRLYDENQELKQRIAELQSKETKKTTKINLNETIKVKLTPYGAEIYYKQFDELNKQCGREICKPQMPKIDKDGYTEFQLWHFIELYGGHIGMCKPNVIDPIEIIVCD